VSWLNKFLGVKNGQPSKRVRICVECGMPVEDHKDWCSILRIKQALERRPLSPTASQN
jgi:hypothetical protein